MTTPRYFALESMTVSADGEILDLEPFAEIPASAADVVWLKRELRAGRVAVMLMPDDEELRVTLERIGFSADAPKPRVRKTP